MIAWPCLVSEMVGHWGSKVEGWHDHLPLELDALQYWLWFQNGAVQQVGAQYWLLWGQQSCVDPRQSAEMPIAEDCRYLFQAAVAAESSCLSFPPQGEVPTDSKLILVGTWGGGNLLFPSIFCVASGFLCSLGFLLLLWQQNSLSYLHQNVSGGLLFWLFMGYMSTKGFQFVILLMSKKSVHVFIQLGAEVEFCLSFILIVQLRADMQKRNTKPLII